jgi:hypothetical protein
MRVCVPHPSACPFLEENINHADIRKRNPKGKTDLTKSMLLQVSDVFE